MIFGKMVVRADSMGSAIRATSVFSLSFCVASVAMAYEFETNDSDVSVHWDNTVKYSNAFRLKRQSAGLLGNPNTDDGDRNFNRGLISNRFDILSELDATFKNFGFRLSAAAWYDDIYHQSSDNNSPNTANDFFGGKEFPKDTRDLHGKKAELLDAFVFGRGRLGDGEGRWSFRAGQYALQWGETLFFGANGIAGGQAPVDVIKALSVPGTQFKELIRPTEQLSFSLQPNQDLLLSAYYQFEWESTRLPGVGSYYSSSDILDKGGARMLLGQPPMAPNQLYLERASDLKPRNSGQWGVQARFRLPDSQTDLGVYAIRFHDKTPQLYLQPGADVFGARIGRYRLAYAEGIRAYGISANHTFGSLNLAGEVSVRRNTPLVNDGVVLGPTVIPADGNPRYPVGNSLHGNLSAIWTLPANSVVRESNFTGEIAWNRRTSITRNREALAANASRDAVALRAIFTPTFRQVQPGLDIDVPIGIGYAPLGKSSVVSSFGANHGGDITIGLLGTYQSIWKGSVNLTHYFGAEGSPTDAAGHLTFKQSLKDRDFISFSISTTF